MTYNSIIMPDADAYLKRAWNLATQIISRTKVHLDLNIIQKNVDLISKIFLSIFQIFLILIVGTYMVMLANFILTGQEGITILPFDTSGMGKDCSGKAVADRLSMEMRRIGDIHEHKQMLINSSEIIAQRNITITGTPFQPAQLIPPIVSKSQTMDKGLSEMGNVVVGPASVSLGQLLLILRSITGKSDKSITGSVEKYGSNISIVALMEDKNSRKGTLAWEMTLPLSDDNSSIEEKVPILTRDLAYNIVHDIGSWNDSQAIVLHKSWVSFKYLTEGWNAYIEYDITGDISDLERATDMIKKVIQVDPDYPELAQLFLIVRFAYQAMGDGNEERLLDLATRIPVLSGDVWYNKGVSFYYQEMWSDAADAFGRATEIDPNNKLYWASKSFVLNKNGTYEEALQAAEVAIKLDPSYADAWHEKGIALYYLGDYHNSSQAHKKSITLDGKIWWYYHDYAILLWGMGNSGSCDGCYAEAVERLDTALRLDLTDDEKDAIIKLKENIINAAQMAQ